MSQQNCDEKDKKIRELYRYDEMSNKVLRADRSLYSQRTDPLKDAAESQPKSMLGRISVKEMGASAPRSQLTDADRNIYQTEAAGREISKVKPRTNTQTSRNAANSTVLSGDSMQKLKYYPSDDANADRYDEIVHSVSVLLGDDMPHDIIRSATDYVLNTLKGKPDEEGLYLDRKLSEIQENLAVPISQSTFHQIVDLSKDITDYYQSTQQQRAVEEGVAILASEDEMDGLDGDEGQNTLLNELEEMGEGSDDEEAQDVRNENEALRRSTGLDHQKWPAESATNDDTKNDGDTLTFVQAKERKEGKSDRIVTIGEVDDRFLLRSVSAATEEIEERKLQDLCERILQVLGANLGEADLEAELSGPVELRDEWLVKFLVKNGARIFWGTKLSNAPAEEKVLIFSQMRQLNLTDLVEEYETYSISLKRRLSTDHKADGRAKKQAKISLPNTLDLQQLAFDQGSEVFTAERITLPANSFKRVKPSYEEIHIPPPSPPSAELELVPITTLPKWAKNAFPLNETTHLNRIQSEVFPSAFGNDDNLLICAPTGSGKTNIAMLTILRVLSHHLDQNRGTFNLKNFKVVYIAPLKALVQEQVREFQRRLMTYGIKVGELTGDSNITRQQIVDSTVLIATPEKWDIITRKREDGKFTSSVELLIIDEVHLLHDERGPVLESIVARSLRDKTAADKMRIVALSATLPNYSDVGRFLRVPKKNLFYFDSSFRPCPLAQQFCGVTETNAVKKVNAMNQACYDKLLELVEQGHQVIVFVHSRKDTARTALWLKNKLSEEDKLDRFIKSEPGSKEIIKRETENISDRPLAELIQYGFGIHHAGLTKSDRSLSEDLFADGLLSVLVSTATLAWGVNLPAHAVIIKGTDVYSPIKGTWTRLSPQDVLQMLGRAGRPRYDTFGEGIIITQQSSIQYYLAMLNQQLPIESQLVSKLADNMNAEIVLGNIKNRKEAVEWLGFTYLFVRMLENPDLYKCPSNDNGDDFLLEYRDQLSHSALELLHEHNLVVYDVNTASVLPTGLGKIASHFYIKYHSVSMYNQNINEHLTSIDILRIFSKSDEFKYIPVRQEEKLEVQKLLEKAPIPIQEPWNEPIAKVNVLLQSYISRTKLDGFALKSDMLYITQSAGRLTRALYELAYAKKLPRLAKLLLNLCKSIEKRMWITSSALRQFKDCPSEVIRHTEASFLPWQDYFLLSSPREVGEAIRSEGNGKLVYDILQKFPRLDVRCSIQPLTPSVLHFDLEISPKWTWDSKIHGTSERFVVMVENEMGDKLLYDNMLIVKQKYANKEHYLDFSIFLTPAQQQMLPSNFFISLISDRWLHSEFKIPVLLDNVRLPRKFPAPTPLLNVERVPVSEVGVEFSQLFDFENFNRIQSQVFPTLFDTNDSILIGSATGSGRITMAEIALLNLWRQGGGRSVFVCPSQEKVDSITDNWTKRFRGVAGGKIINKFTDNNVSNLKLLAKSHLILCTPEQFDVASRKWKQRKNIQSIALLILDEAHMVGDGLTGAIYENIISRMNFIAAQLETGLRIVGLSNCVANSRDFGEWMSVRKENIFNFTPADRVSPLQIKFQAGPRPEDRNTDICESLWPLCTNILRSGSDYERAVVFVPSRAQATKLMTELIRLCTENKLVGTQSNIEPTDCDRSPLSNELLRASLRWGFGALNSDLTVEDCTIVKKLFKTGALKLLFVCRGVELYDLRSSTVVLFGTSYYEGNEHRYVDYTVNEIQKMLSTASLSSKLNEAFIMTSEVKKEHYRKFLTEPLPVESFMYYYLPDAISREISTGVIESKQDCIDWLTFTLFYRRIHGNPSFYGVKNISSLGVSAYLTELVEEVTADLTKYSMIEIDNDEQNEEIIDAEEKDSIMSPLNGCMISAYHNVSFASIQVFHQNLSRASGLKSLLEAIASSFELGSVALRESDVDTLKLLYNRLPVKSAQITDVESAAFKVFVLLQCHFSRLQLRNELKNDLVFILKRVTAVVNALVDFMAGEGNLNATIAMDLSQMLIQGMWDTDSPLLQVPYFDSGMIDRCKKKGIETVYDIMALEDDERDEILVFDDRELTSIATFVNAYPNVELAYALSEDSSVYKPGAPINISVTLTRDEEPESLQVVADKFPQAKNESWWLVAGETTTKELYFIKKVSLSKETQTYDLEISLNEEGSHKLTLWCVSDAYIDADKEVSFEVLIQ
ncbi:LAME_0G09340g1_1 [Lachancea meyersii CBS 8951]|uniref:U5 small nuclear ribonucleoprotein 200 kDa helicase n=1 Tax=Lachancea meyersii CBS 8951 TaxID=1266667 RepID=A0A1G4K8K6_9SACH|nr:LAME_0G09340g1_1 [Lachancea meyersii CBS 8951]